MIAPDGVGKILLVYFFIVLEDIHADCFQIDECDGQFAVQDLGAHRLALKRFQDIARPREAVGYLLLLAFERCALRVEGLAGVAQCQELGRLADDPAVVVIVEFVVPEFQQFLLRHQPCGLSFPFCRKRPETLLQVRTVPVDGFEFRKGGKGVLGKLLYQHVGVPHAPEAILVIVCQICGDYATARQSVYPPVPGVEFRVAAGLQFRFVIFYECLFLTVRLPVVIAFEEKQCDGLSEIRNVLVAGRSFGVPELPVAGNAHLGETRCGVVVVPSKMLRLRFGLDLFQNRGLCLGLVGSFGGVILLPERYQGVVVFIFRGGG